ncbi:AMP-binding protein [Aurantimonas coralicida]|uniref:AMP-binding protein n=1 Tax=Aurantimonas coralicida TaxID=182270 RepID=UPI00238AAC06|nr:AMP-binding protein [Aurantimonas coralicida]MDE0921754.1 AMP-binding protein [Aurantimonas coralicida]
MIRFDDRDYDFAALLALAAQMQQGGRLGSSLHGTHAICLTDPAELMAAFLLIRQEGGSVMPLHPATPATAARRIALSACCDTLTFGRAPVEALEPDARQREFGHRLIQTSSGTTGEAKIIARTFEDIEAEIESYVGFFEGAHDKVPVVACPISHSYGLICGLLAGVARGVTPLVLSPDNPKYVLSRMAEMERPLLYAAPAFLNVAARFLKQGETMHAAMTSGTLLPAPWFEAIRAKTGTLFQQYGCSEAGVVAVSEDLVAANEMGRPLPHHRVQAGTAAEPAEIIVDTPWGTVGTRDLGHLRDDGVLVFDARLDDTIIVSGLNVYPREVEDVVMAMPGIDDAVVFGLDDAFAGGRVALVYTGADDVTEAAIAQWCGTQLAGHQRPREMRRAAAIPRGGTGKISRREIRILYTEDRL